MFKRSKTPSISSIPDRESVTASLHSRETTRRSPVVSQRRQPDSGVGLAKLLETYDEYPHLVEQLEVTTEQLRIAEGQAEEAESLRFAKEDELVKEKEGREADATQAKKDKSAAEIAREKKIRDELEPKIKDLQEKNKTLTTERDKLKKELADLRLQSQKWINGIETLHKERLLIEERENKAAEERKLVDEKRKTLEKSILDGLKEASTIPAATTTTTEKDKDATSIKTSKTSATAAPTTSEKTATATTTATPFGAGSTTKKAE